MEAKRSEHRRGKQGADPRSRRLVLISSDGEGGRPEPPLRIVDTEPRLRGGFRLTDR